MTNQIETTLQDAIKRHKKEGGLFWEKGKEFMRYNPKYDIDEFNMNFSIEQVCAVWVYEPPQKTAFQEWHKNTYHYALPDNVPYERRIELRKEGWNGLSDLLISIIKEKYGTVIAAAICCEIEKLKEP